MLDKARQGLAALIHNYADFPLAFLVETAKAEENGSRSELEDLREAIASISDRQSQSGIYAQAAVVYISFVNHQLNVART